jgi:hypothetical protein
VDDPPSPYTPQSALLEEAATIVLCLVDKIYAAFSPYSSPNLSFR